MSEQEEEKAPNPWLEIPGEDYEAHMSSPEVDQSRFLSDTFESAGS